MKEIKILICAKILNWLIDFLPDGEFKKEYCIFISNHIMKL